MIKFTIFSFMFITMYGLGFSQSVDIYDLKEKFPVFDFQTINDTTIQCFVKEEDPQLFFGITTDEFIELFKPEKKVMYVNIKGGSKSKHKTSVQLKYNGRQLVYDLLYYKKRLWNACFFYESGSSFIEYALWTNNPFKYYLSETTTWNKDCTTNIQYYSNGRIKSIEVTVVNNSSAKKVKTCFDKTGRIIQCPRLSGFL